LRTRSAQTRWTRRLIGINKIRWYLHKNKYKKYVFNFFSPELDAEKLPATPEGGEKNLLLISIVFDLLKTFPHNNDVKSHEDPKG
jgi:hypothetical protein